MSSFFSFVFGKLAEISAGMWIALVVLAAFAVALIVLAPKIKWNAKMLATAALCIAASFVLSYIRLYSMPQGGSVTLFSMLPVMLFAYLYGVGPGLLAGLAFGVLSLIQDPQIYTPMQVILDYVIAFSVLGLAGLFKSVKCSEAIAFPVGVALAGLARTLSSFLSGFIFFGEYAPAGQSPIIYSLVYNFSSIGVDTLLCILGALLLCSTGLLRQLKRR